MRPRDLAHISAAVQARHGELHVSISRHATSDTILVQFRVYPPVPFEDLAVAMGKLDIEEVLNRVRPTNDLDFQPLVPLEDALAKLAAWRDKLTWAFGHDDFRTKLGDIAHQVAHEAGLLADP